MFYKLGEYMASSQELCVSTASVSQGAAQLLISAALDAAAEIGVDVSVAVVDAGGALKGFSRTDRAPFLTVEAAINKAWTAASYGYATHVWSLYLADPKLAQLSKLSQFLAVGGGIPLMVGGMLVGAIGVSGGTYDQDQEIAEAASRKVGFFSV